MKKTLILLGTLLLTWVSSPIYAKLSKDERRAMKEWKKRKKSMSPSQLKDLIEENHKLKMEAAKSPEKSSEAQTKKITELEKELDALRKEGDGGKGGERKGMGEDFTKGIVFKVQIGAYRKRDLSNILAGSEGDLVQEKVDDLNKYTLGSFRDYWKADQLKKEIRAMGIKDAWIVPLKDGQRIPLKDALNKVQSK